MIYPQFRSCPARAWFLCYVNACSLPCYPRSLRHVFSLFGFLISPSTPTPTPHFPASHLQLTQWFCYLRSLLSAVMPHPAPCRAQPQARDRARESVTLLPDGDRGPLRPSGDHTAAAASHSRTGRGPSGKARVEPADKLLQALQQGAREATLLRVDNAFFRCVQVLLDKVAMMREYERLQKENQDLRTILKRYLDGISVNDSVMGQSNPLLIVNGS